MDLARTLIDAAKQGTIELKGTGLRLDSQNARELSVFWDSDSPGGLRFVSEGKSQEIDLDEIRNLADQGQLVLTLRAELGSQAIASLPQPELWTSGNIQQQRGRQVFPIANGQDKTLRLSGRYFGPDAWIFVDGNRVSGTIEIDQADRIVLKLDELPQAGIHFLQVQVPRGFMSNDFIFYAAQDRAAALAFQQKIDEPHSESAAIKRALEDKSKINDRMNGGATPLSQAALWGQLALVKELLGNGADLRATNSDGNTPLHLAAFMCHQEVVELLIEHGAEIDRKNNRGETPLDVVNQAWTEELAEFYRQLGVSLSLPVDTIRLQKDRPKMVSILSGSK
jgi:hypothetical protein